MKNVEIIEISPRNGIQNEKKLLSLETKLELIDRALKAVGLLKAATTAP